MQSLCKMNLKISVKKSNFEKPLLKLHMLWVSGSLRDWNMKPTRSCQKLYFLDGLFEAVSKTESVLIGIHIKIYIRIKHIYSLVQK